MTKQERIDLGYLRMAFMLAFSFSKDPSTQVGAILLGADGRSVSTGYNGMPAGALETHEIWTDRAKKYPRVKHAEVNAIINCPFSRQDATIYCSLFPCADCLGLIVNAGIKTVVYYGNMWDREPHPEIVEELKTQIEVRGYNADPVIDKLIVLHAGKLFPDLTIHP